MGAGWHLFDPHPQSLAAEPDGIRVGDAERDQAVTLLGEHYAAGRLDRQEHQGRADRALQATLSSELDALFADLPADSQPQQYGALAAAGPARASGFHGTPARWPAPPPVLLLVPLVIGGLFVLSALMHAPWFLIGLIWLAVMFHRGRGPFSHPGQRGDRGRGHRDRRQPPWQAPRWPTPR